MILISYTKKVTKNIVNDWSSLSEYSSDFYYKYSKEELTDSDKKSFDQVSLNMFVRFQIFNNQVEEIDKLSSIIGNVNKSISIIEGTMEKLSEKDEKLTNKLVELEDFESFI